jgi:hypothetical protein
LVPENDNQLPLCPHSGRETQQLKKVIRNLVIKRQAPFLLRNKMKGRKGVHALSK